MVISVILPLVLLTLIGYFSAKLKLVERSHISALSNFVIKISLPAFLLYALADKDIYALWQPSYFLAYGLASLLLFGAAFFMFRHYFQMSMTHSAVMSMGASMSNTGFIGTAILTMLIGSHAAIYISLTLLVENLMIVVLMLCLAEIGLSHGKSSVEQTEHTPSPLQVLLKTLKGVLLHPVIVSIVLGLICSLMSWQLPEQLHKVLTMLGNTAAPIALFVIGASLVGVGLKALNLGTWLLVSMKVVLMPLLVFGFLSMLPNVSQEMLYAGTLIAALPMPVSFGIFGQAYGLNEKALTPLMLSTIIGFAVISLLIVQWYS